ncbi:MAG: 50S ribosomal protein L32 [Peptococcaceae bacterium]|nr:50S ribosomal protein L32 [Peptococcaceae bacterium]
MGVPQHRQSKSRVRKRRAMAKLTAPSLTACPQCRKLRMPHHMCPACGYYDGKAVVAVAE